MHELFWVTAFLDVPAPTHPATLEFWRAVTGYGVSPPRGAHGEFVTLVPSEGDDHLRVQRLERGGPRIHLDLHVADPRAAADRARTLGAQEEADLGHVVMRSPGGFPFCFVTHPASTVAPPMSWADGSTSIVDQVCLDVPASRYEAEAGFWADLTGWLRVPSPAHEELERLQVPPGQPLKLLLQRLREDAGPVRAHLDLACDDRGREVLRHLRLGAVREVDREQWTVLRDPSGAAYCLTDRRPAA